MFHKTQAELSTWKKDLHVYQKNKRTKKPFGKSLPQIQHVTHEDIKHQQTRFNPVLQTYKHESDEERRTFKDNSIRNRALMNHFKQAKKYDRSYDIVNLHSNSDIEIDIPNKKLGPIRNIYNIINNQKLPDFYFRNREFKVPIQRQKNLIKYNQKQFNILTGIYNQNHEDRINSEEQSAKNHIMDKYWKTHEYDPVFGKFYDKSKQKQYHKERQMKEKQHGKDYDKKFPISYIERQGFIPDPTKPLPQALKTLDQKKLNAKKRFKNKYAIEDEYGQRNFEDDRKHQTIIKSKIHNNRIIQEKSKEFNIVTNQQYPQARAQNLYGKNIVRTTWERLMPDSALKIKTQGFN